MAQTQKCVHKGCGKTFTDPDEDCIYHPGPPEFHEGQKGWKCCKPRVLTFDEFLSIPPCTTGKHSTVDDTPQPPKKPPAPTSTLADYQESLAKLSAKAMPPSSSSNRNLAQPVPKRVPIPTRPSVPQTAKPTTPQPELFEDSDPENAEIPAGATCKRRSCGKPHSESTSRDDEECIYHPGVPLFHEGSKGWTCCKRRVLEFDEFMKIEGCKKRKRHCYIGKKPDKTADGATAGAGTATTAGATTDADGNISTVRHDFYQTPTSVIVSFYLKRIDKGQAKVIFAEDRKSVDLDLPTSDGKRFKQVVPLSGTIDPEKSSFKIMGTKLELTLAKGGDGAGWAVLRADERDTGERIQIGRAGRA